MRKLLFWIFIITVITQNQAHAAGASDNQHGYIGILGGITLPSNASTTFAYGVNFIYRLGPLFAVGAFLENYSVGVDASSGTSRISASTSNISWGLEGDYFFRGSLQNFRTGLRMGLVSIGTTASATDTSNSTSLSISSSQTGFVCGPLIGYDYFFGRWSLGAEFNFNFGVGGNAPNTLYFLPAFKFWF